MRSRRAFLGSVGTAATASLAGCSGFGQEDTGEPDIDPSAVADIPQIGPVSTLPVEIPDSFFEAHRTRASELLESVRTDPQIPNGVVARRIEEDRKRVAQDLDSKHVDEPFVRRRLAATRHLRERAASVRGEYRAATGLDDGEEVRERRLSLRSNLGSVTADLEYRAASLVDAVLVYSTVEDLLDGVRGDLDPRFPYPERPTEDVERAGRAVGALEGASAQLEDVRGIHEQYLARGETESQVDGLLAAARALQFAVHVSSRDLRRYYTESADTVFDIDIRGTVAGTLFQEAARDVQPMMEHIQEEYRDGRFASAILDSGRLLATLAVLRSVVDAIEDDGLSIPVTTSRIEEAAAAARQAIQTLRETASPRLHTAIATDAIYAYESGARYLVEDHFDATDALAEFTYASLLARAAPKAADYTIQRLEDAQ